MPSSKIIFIMHLLPICNDSSINKFLRRNLRKKSLIIRQTSILVGYSDIKPRNKILLRKKELTDLNELSMSYFM